MWSRARSWRSGGGKKNRHNVEEQQWWDKAPNIPEQTQDSAQNWCHIPDEQLEGCQA